ncbi:hypothetical protein J4E91_002541 [Alternaria rosae]|nr:hypothetical protein J4E91_002541 [Alternaria rosae]
MRPPNHQRDHVYDKIITVAVGPDEAKKKFKIYRGLLCHFSSHFDRMLNGPFREGSSIYLRLRDVDAEIFSIFYCWLNSGLVHCGDSLAWKSLTDAYIFADYHQSPLFRSAVLDYLYLRYSAEKKITVFADLLYGNTTERDWMSKLVVDFMAAADGFRQCTQTVFTPCEKFINNIYAFVNESNSNTVTMSHPLARCADPWTAPIITKKHDTITIKVGTGVNIRQYDLHVEALRARSRHFHEALPASPSNEGRTTIHLAETAPKPFDVFANWLYNGKLDYTNDLNLRYLFLCELHVFADTFDVSLLCNKVVDVFFNKLLRDAQSLPYDIMKYTEEYLKDSALRTMMQDIMLNCGETKDMAEWKVNFAKGFRVKRGGKKDVVEALGRSSNVREYLIGLKSKVCGKYHEHVERDEMVIGHEEMWFFDPPLR